MSVKNSKTILIAPLDWGLGHATRCIPIINELIQLDCKVIIAAEGKQENLLKAEFPFVESVHLPGYRINYSKEKRFFSLKIILQLPKIFRAIKAENRWLNNFLKTNKVDAVISDNRYGLYSPLLQSVFITHQLHIKAPFVFAERWMRKVNYKWLSNFSQCWIPDEEGRVNVAGILSHPSRLPPVPIRYIGGLSRLNKMEGPGKKYELIIVMSGPEPQRTLFEKTILQQLKDIDAAVLLVRALPGSKDKLTCGKNVTIKNHLTAAEMEQAFNESAFVISRSGYTTVMDILKLGKKSVLVPTPGQTEQEYLAQHLEEQGWCLSARQTSFSLKESWEKAKQFSYKLPKLDMEQYKGAVHSFITNIEEKRPAVEQ